MKLAPELAYRARWRCLLPEVVLTSDLVNGEG